MEMILPAAEKDSRISQLVELLVDASSLFSRADDK
jgi:hypothetical protein